MEGLPFTNESLTSVQTSKFRDMKLVRLTISRAIALSLAIHWTMTKVAQIVMAR